jgi:hypothetical protein
MYLQLVEIALLIVALAVLGLIIFFISRRGPPPPAEPVVRYTPGEQEILRQLGELKEKVDKMIPPYGGAGCMPSSIEELKELPGSTYVAEPVVRYTPGEQEILRQLGELKEKVDKMIPPYGRVGYIPSSIEELKELFGFTYVKLGEREIGERPSGLEKVEDLDVDFLQARLGDNYVYVVKKGGKKLTAAGSQYLDYLTVCFLFEFLDYI